MRDKNEEELQELEKELRDQLVKLNVAKATQRTRDTSTFNRVKKDIARVKTILHERKLGIAGDEVAASEGEG